MFHTHFHRHVLVCALALGATTAYAASPAPLDTARIEQMTGLTGMLNKEENVFKVTKPRSDVAIQVDGFLMPPFMGLTSWAAFTPSHDAQVMVMGDIVLLEDEVDPVMSAALDGGLEVTALHNHFFFDQPKVYFMHIGGDGDANRLAAGVKKVFDIVSTIRAAHPTRETAFSGRIPSESSISAAPLDAVFGRKGQSNNGMFKMVIGRRADMHGVPVGNEMGVNTWAAFAGSDEEAVVDGDFVMLETELQPVLKSMRAGGINIVAIHNHMVQEQPRYLFLHYWGKGEALDLAKTVQRTLELQKQ